MKRNFLLPYRRYTWTGSLMRAAILVSTLGIVGAYTPLAHAQVPQPIPLTSTVYAAKFICGFKPGFTPPQSRVLLGPAIYDYRDFEPGSYATALNVLFVTGARLYTTTNINVFVSVPETSHNAAVQGVNLGPLSISNFGTVNVDCEDIAQALRGPLPQVADKEVIEGFLYITRSIDDLVVEAVYSYSSEIGSLGGEPRHEGGIGVGSSLHVQNIEPKTYSIRFPLVLNGPNVNRTP
ncbi:MAG: hypothetical protein NPIRA02_19690 [Nitrospirales bacterium]|nr:MAG: hypothetical protein NPIRA02_19690 [Nitrospirales bacterium]